MIKLSEKQILRLDENLADAMEDLCQGVFWDDNPNFLSIGANVGLALQKLHDIRTFIADLAVKEEMSASAQIDYTDNLKVMEEALGSLRKPTEEEITECKKHIHEDLKSRLTPIQVRDHLRQHKPSQLYNV